MRTALAALLLVSAAFAGEIKISTPRGDPLAATLDPAKAPNGVGVLLAPGQGYHKDLPLLERSAKRLAAAGFTVLRFNWGYFTKDGRKGKPSPDLSREVEDVEAALVALRKIDGVKRVILAGKSLGSLVAVLRAAKTQHDLLGVALLTYPLHMPKRPDQPWPGADKLKSLKVPTFILCGNGDHLCSLPSLYALAATCSQPVEIVITPGNHGLAEEGEGKTDENIDLAARALTLWAKRRVG